MRLTLLLLTTCIAGCTVDERTDRIAPAREEADTMTTTPFLGLRSAIYHVADLQAAKQWYATLLGTQPYFDEPFYVGFDVGGYELGLNPDTAAVQPGPGGAMLYWGVSNADSVLAKLLEMGATQVEGVTDVGGGIRHAIVRDPFDNLVGIIENPHFKGGS